MSKVFLKNGMLSKAGRETLVSLLMQEEIGTTWKMRIHGVRELGRGRWVTLSYALDVQARELLTALGVPFTEGNDAPRGGKTGAYLEYDYYTLYEKIVKWCKKP